MTKIMKIIVLFLGCRLLWIWVDQCGAEIGMGESLPFCLECTGFVSLLRLAVLGGTIHSIYKTLQRQPDVTDLIEREIPQAQTVRIHWDRIFLLLAILLYPIWVYWVDINITIPGPNETFILKGACKYARFKGTLLWIIEMLFISMSFKLLHNNSNR